MQNPAAGDRLADRYRLIERRGTGATATVWSAHDELLDRAVAVKVMHSHLATEDVAVRFAGEARTAAAISHRSLVGIYDTLVGPPPAIVMEWVDGGDLRSRLDAGGALDPTEVVMIGSELADALAALHAQGLLHRDVKPANVLLTERGHPKLTDFGIATTNPGDLTATGIVVGTAKYLAPEQVRGDALDGRSDVYSTCAVLYEATTGRPPFERDGDLPTAIARLEESPVDPRVIRSGTPQGLAAIVMRGLERDAAHRWPTAADLHDAFVQFARTGEAPAPIAESASVFTLPPIAGGDRTGQITRPPLPPPAVRGRSPRPMKPKRRRWPLAIGVVVFLAIAGFAAGLVATGGVTDLLGDEDPIPLAGIVAFDPEGTGTPGEHDDLAVLATDGDTTTAWITENYEQRDLGTKSGVGLVVDLGERQRVEDVRVRTVAGDDWAAEIRIADEKGAELDAYGPAVSTGSALGGSSRFEVGADGRYVLLWITDLGGGPLPRQLGVAEIAVR